jgi:hypothetical protein
MLAASTRTRHGSSRSRQFAKPRKGIALVFVLVFVVAMAALAMGSIFMASNANLLAKSYDKEKDLKYAAELALQMGKSRVNSDPNILNLRANQLDTLILDKGPVLAADGSKLPGITVSIYLGPTGSTSGQFGRFTSIVAEARDQRGNGFIRRLELTQESFAKFAYWSNDESAGSTTIFFNNGDELWGPVWSNDTIHVGSNGSPAAIFHDEVGTAKVVTGKTNANFVKGVQERQKAISLPSTTQLSNLKTLAGTTNSLSSAWYGATSTTTNASADEAKLHTRLEFLATDLHANVPVPDSLESDEGFFRVYQAKDNNQSAFVRGEWPGTYTAAPAQTLVNFCGDWHWATVNSADGTPVLQFYPVTVHNQVWFRNQVQTGYQVKNNWTAAVALAQAKKDSAETTQQILDNPNARCYLAGDPHLVAVDRVVGGTDPRRPGVYTYTAAMVQKGGTDTTFTPIGAYGRWKAYSGPVVPPADTTFRNLRPWDGQYLFPIDRKYNDASRGVIFVDGNIGLSGTVNGRVTLYSLGTVVLLDDIRYANDPVRGVCRDILGIIATKDVVIADNALNTPPSVVPSTKTPQYFSLDDTKDIYIHAVMMALDKSFRVEAYNLGPTDVNDCATGTGVVNNGRGCIYLSGGIIQLARGAVGTSGGTGYTKRYSYDRCAVVNPPPYFPTTGRFQDNRYLELDPTGFKHDVYFKSLTPDP